MSRSSTEPALRSLARARLAANLRTRIAANRWSAREAACRLGVSRRYLASVLAGRVNLGIDSLDRFADALALQPAQLLKGEAGVAQAEPRPRQRSRSLLAANLRRRAHALGLRIDELAARSGYSRRHLYDVTAARVNTGIDLIAPMAHVLRVGMHELLLSVKDRGRHKVQD